MSSLAVEVRLMGISVNENPFFMYFLKNLYKFFKNKLMAQWLASCHVSPIV